MVDWVYDELVLAADLVSRNGWSGVRRSSPEAVALSQLLRVGQLHLDAAFPDNFRSPSSIQRKTYDLVTADAVYGGVATKGGRLDAVVIAEFRKDTALMQARALAIRDALRRGESVAAIAVSNELDDAGASEGGILQYIARRRERDRGLRERKIQDVIGAGGTLACEVCGFDFSAAYGERGVGYIEVHHVEPLHVSGETKTNLGDLALLCSNCHRMCHRGQWITPATLSTMLAR